MLPHQCIRKIANSRPYTKTRVISIKVSCTEQPSKKRKLEPTSSDDEQTVKRRKHDHTIPGRDAVRPESWRTLPTELKQKIALQTLEDLFQQTIRLSSGSVGRYHKRRIFHRLRGLAGKIEIPPPRDIRKEYIRRIRTDLDAVLQRLYLLSGAQPEILTWPLRQMLKHTLEAFWQNSSWLKDFRIDYRYLPPGSMVPFALSDVGEVAFRNAWRLICSRLTKRGRAMIQFGEGLRAVLEQIPGGLDGLSVDKPAHLTPDHYLGREIGYLYEWRRGEFLGLWYDDDGSWKFTYHSKREEDSKH